MTSSEEATHSLLMSAAGDTAATERLFEQVYATLREIAARFMRRERCDHTLNATALVHEAFIRLIDGARVDWKGKSHFLAVAANAMRRVLLDHAKKRKAQKRGGLSDRVTLTDSAGVVDQNQELDALDLGIAVEELSQLNPRHAQVVEMRILGGMRSREIAQVLGVSERTAQDDWRFARAWLRARLSR